MGWYVIKGTKKQLLAPDILQYIISRQLGVSGLTKNHTPPYQLLTPSGFFQRWFLPFPLISPLPLHSNFFNLWKWSTAWLASLEDLPTPTLTQKYLLPSQCFGSRPSVFILHSSVWRVEGTDLALLFIVLLRRFSNMCLEVKKGVCVFCITSIIWDVKTNVYLDVLLSLVIFTKDVFGLLWLLM